MTYNQTYHLIITLFNQSIGRLIEIAPYTHTHRTNTKIESIQIYNNNTHTSDRIEFAFLRGRDRCSVHIYIYIYMRVCRLISQGCVTITALFCDKKVRERQKCACKSTVACEWPQKTELFAGLSLSVGHVASRSLGKCIFRPVRKCSAGHVRSERDVLSQFIFYNHRDLTVNPNIRA